MSAAVKSLGVLAASVHVLDPVERIPVVLLAGESVTDPAVAEQITNPRCWEGGCAGTHALSCWTRTSQASMNVSTGSSGMPRRYA
ncbi:hypothetical protein AB0N07_33100, partial [Streptomyces sp. NPDC051172]|uniref:hypothetical protein n=1 Tax=Streptomyces sp. NPDC051172 TaxID=3155796 RepID=UPI00341E73F2